MCLLILFYGFYVFYKQLTAVQEVKFLFIASTALSTEYLINVFEINFQGQSNFSVIFL